MTIKQKVDKLWDEMRAVINSTYEQSRHHVREDPRTLLRDHAEDLSWTDAMGRLLTREQVNERQHRNRRPLVPGFSSETAAKVILLGNFCEGMKKGKQPLPATIFLQFRHTAAEMLVVGQLCRLAKIPASFQAEVLALDYAKLMGGGRK